MITGNDVNTRLQKFLLRRIEPSKLKFITDDELLAMYNEVCKAYVDGAEMLVGKFNQDVTDDSIELESDVISVLSFICEDSTINTGSGESTIGNQSYVRVDEFLVLRYEIENTACKIFYTRSPNELIVASDPFDIPAKAESNLMELIKAKAVYEFAEGNLADYEGLLQKYIADYILTTAPFRLTGGVRRNWIGADDNYYEIYDKEEGQENVVKSVTDGKWHWVS